MNNIFTAPSKKDAEMHGNEYHNTNATSSSTSPSVDPAVVTPRSPIKTGSSSTPITGGVVTAPTPSTSTFQREQAQVEQDHDHNHNHDHHHQVGDENQHETKKAESVLDKAKDLISSHAPGSGVAAVAATSNTNRQDHEHGHKHVSDGVGLEQSRSGSGSGVVSGSRGVAPGEEIEAGKLQIGESTKTGNDLLGGLALGAPIGGGSCELGRVGLDRHTVSIE
jgi:hypothetical protein